MRILIIADIEGAVGIYQRRQCHSIKPEYQQGRICLTKDVNCVVKGVMEGGATSVVVRDTHDMGFNIIQAELHPHAEYIGGQFLEPFPILGNLENVDLALFVAFHTSSGNDKGFFAHTFFGGFNEVKINGARVGEAFIYGAALGELGIPVIFNSGDFQAIQESLMVMPWLKTVIVPKEEIFYTANESEKFIFNLREELCTKARDAVREHNNMQCLKMPPEPMWEVDVKDSVFAEKINKQRLSIRGNTIFWQSKTYIEGFRNLFNLVHTAFSVIFS